MADVHRQRMDTMAQISSSKRITQAKHDAAGSAVASNLDSAQRSKRQALRNLSEACLCSSSAEELM